MQAFAAAVQTILRRQTSSLQQLSEAVKQRRKAHPQQMHSSLAKEESCHIQELQPAMSLLEVVLHTERLQVMPHM